MFLWFLCRSHIYGVQSWSSLSLRMAITVLGIGSKSTWHWQQKYWALAAKVLGIGSKSTGHWQQKYWALAAKVAALSWQFLLIWVFSNPVLSAKKTFNVTDRIPWDLAILRKLTHWILENLTIILNTLFSNWFYWLKLWALQVEFPGTHWYYIIISSGNGLVPTGNKPLPEPMFTQIYGVPRPSVKGHFGVTYSRCHLQRIDPPPWHNRDWKPMNFQDRQSRYPKSPLNYELIKNWVDETSN